jgi:ketosteroid isomerase-like protein
MKLLLRISSLLLIHLSPMITRGQASLSKEQTEVNNTVLAIGKAWSQNNLDTLEKYIDTDYKHTDTRGQIQDRKAWLGYMVDRKEKHMVNPDIEFEDTRIQIYGEFAFVTGVNIFSGSAYIANDPNAKKPKKLRYTQVLKKEQGIWKRFLFQATYIE